MGDGGAITTNDLALHEKMYQMHDHGRDTQGEIKSWGRNSRLDNLQAAILNFRFKSYEETIKRRRDIATRYNELLKGIQALNLPEPPTENSKNFDTYQNYEITAEYRDDLVSYLKLNGIGTLIQWGGKGIHQWEHVNFQGFLPNTENFFQKCLMLPVNMFVSNADIDYVCEQIHKFYKQKNESIR